MKRITASERGIVIIESALVLGLTSLSGGFYLLGDLSKRFSKIGYSIGAQLDTMSLDLIEFSAQSLEKFMWKEFKEQ